MRRLLSALIIAALLASCAVYTSKDGYERISIPETTGRPATKYAVILQENAEKSEEAIENAKKEAEQKQKTASVFNKPSIVESGMVPPTEE